MEVYGYNIINNMMHRYKLAQGRHFSALLAVSKVLMQH